MHCIGRTFVRLSAENRLRLDRFRRHHSLTRERVVNDIIRDFFNALHSPAREQRTRRRRAA